MSILPFSLTVKASVLCIKIFVAFVVVCQHNYSASSARRAFSKYGNVLRVFAIAIFPVTATYSAPARAIRTSLPLPFCPFPKCWEFWICKLNDASISFPFFWNVSQYCFHWFSDSDHAFLRHYRFLLRHPMALTAPRPCHPQNSVRDAAVRLQRFDRAAMAADSWSPHALQDFSLRRALAARFFLFWHCIPFLVSVLPLYTFRHPPQTPGTPSA